MMMVRIISESYNMFNTIGITLAVYLDYFIQLFNHYKTITFTFSM